METRLPQETGERIGVRLHPAGSPPSPSPSCRGAYRCSSGSYQKATPKTTRFALNRPGPEGGSGGTFPLPSGAARIPPVRRRFQHEPGAMSLRRTFPLPPGSSALLSNLGDDPIIEILIHEEPDCSQPVQLRPDLVQEAALLARHEETDRTNHPKTQRCRKPSRRLFIQNEQRGSQLQTQTDDLTFSWTNGAAHCAGLERMCQPLDLDPVG